MRRCISWVLAALFATFFTSVATTAALAAQNVPAARDSSPSANQDDARADSAPTELRPAIEAKLLTVTTYSPKQFPVELVCKTAEQLFGKQVEVVDPQGGSRNKNGVARLAHFVVLGKMLLIRDSAPEAKKIVDVLDSLEAREIELRKQHEDAVRAEEERARKEEREHANDVEVATQFVVIHPRNVTMNTLLAALEPLRRQVQYQNNLNFNFFQKTGDTVAANGKLVSHGSVMLLGSDSGLAKLLDRVAQIDHAPSQFNVSVMLVSATAKDAAANPSSPTSDAKSDAANASLPDDLAKELERLLPSQHFERWSYGLLRCETHQSKCELKVTTATDGSYWSLQFQSDQFLDETSELELGAVSFHCERARTHPQPPLVQSFETHLTARLGEYVVLGAVGTTPTFVVLRVEPVKQLQ